MNQLFFELLQGSNDSGSYAVKGGNTIMGYLFSYQEKTGMPLSEIMKTPWLMIILGMATAPTVDYKNKKDIKPIETAKDQMNAFSNLFN